MGQWIVGVTSFRKMYALYSVKQQKVENGHIMWVVGGFCGYGGSVWVMGEWAVGQWIVGVTSFQKIFGLCGLKCHIMEIWRDVTFEDGRTEM